MAGRLRSAASQITAAENEALVDQETRRWTPVLLHTSSDTLDGLRDKHDELQSLRV